uniref:Leucine-rich repeat flightless-interacting protein 2 n=1 Tax=Rattus norvegicus TaxID=10116 RepID=A0A8I6AJ95_RAT
MGTPGSGRKRTPVKDRFSAEDEALSNIAREAEARLAAKRAARAEARDIRMRELERQQRESSSKDITGTHWSRASTPKRRDMMYDSIKDRSSRVSSLSRSYSHSLGMKKRPSGSHKDPLASLHGGGLYNPYGSRTPSEYSYCSSRASSSRSSPVPFDDDTASIVSSDRASRGRRESLVSAADYFSRSNRRGSIVSEVDDAGIADLTSLDEKSDKQYAENYTRPSSRNSASATTPLSGNSSRRGSGDTSSLIDPDTSLSELRDIYDLKDQIHDVEGRYMQGLKELKESLSEVEEKYKKAMVSNAQLDNEKNNLIYQVDTLKDVIEEQEEQMAEFYRENEEKSKELERQKHMCSVLQHKMDELKEGLRQRDELIEKHGLVIIPESTPNGDVNHEPVVGAITAVSQEAAQVLESAGEGPLDVRLRKLAEEKDELLSQIRKLKLQLEEERQKCSRNDGMSGDLAGLQNGSDLQFIEMQRDANRQISEYKFKLSKAEQDIATLEQSISRLEGQVLRYKTAAENAEKIEDELKAEKRKLQRELRTAQDKIEEMEMTNSHLAKRLEKMKANRTALLAQQ